MILTAEAQALVESRLRVHLHDESLRLPLIHFHVGRAAHLLTRTLRIGAITFGRHVLVARSWLAQSEAGETQLPGWLVVHEAVHVLQYRRTGVVRFLCAYLADYARGLLRGRQFNKTGHRAAYTAIAHEVEAHRAETAYRLWADSPEARALRLN